jgi:hypothetical protein
MAIRNDFAPGEVLAAADLNDTFGSKGDGLFVITGQSLTTVSSVSINSCFSASFQHYLAIISVTGSTELSVRARLRSGTTDDTGNNYDRQVLNASDTTVAAARVTAQAQWDVCTTTTGRRAIAAMTIASPFLSVATSFVCPSEASVSGARFDARSGTHSQATSYDGMTFFTSTGTMSGSIRIYGYN